MAILKDDKIRRHTIESLEDEHIKLKLIKNQSEYSGVCDDELFNLVLIDRTLTEEDIFSKNIPVIAIKENVDSQTGDDLSGISISEPYNRKNFVKLIYNELYKVYIDESHIFDLFGDNREKYLELTDTFFSRYVDIEENIKDFDNTEVKEYAHKLKGTAGTLGLAQIYRLAKDMQDDVENTNLFKQLLDALEITKELLRNDE